MHKISGTTQYASEWLTCHRDISVPRGANHPIRSLPVYRSTGHTCSFFTDQFSASWYSHSSRGSKARKACTATSECRQAQVPDYEATDGHKFLSLTLKPPHIFAESGVCSCVTASESQCCGSISHRRKHPPSSRKKTHSRLFLIIVRVRIPHA